MKSLLALVLVVIAFESVGQDTTAVHQFLSRYYQQYETQNWDSIALMVSPHWVKNVYGSTDKIVESYEAGYDSTAKSFSFYEFQTLRVSDIVTIAGKSYCKVVYRHGLNIKYKMDSGLAPNEITELKSIDLNSYIGTYGADHVIDMIIALMIYPEETMYLEWDNNEWYFFSGGKYANPVLKRIYPKEVLKELKRL